MSIKKLVLYIILFNILVKIIYANKVYVYINPCVPMVSEGPLLSTNFIES